MTRGFLSLSQIDSRDLQRKTARRMSTKEEVWQKAKSKYGFICHMPKNREQRGVWSRGMQIGNTPWPKDQGCRIWLVTERVLSKSRTSSVQSERALCKPSCPVIVYGATVKWLKIFPLCHFCGKTSVAVENTVTEHTKFSTEMYLFPLLNYISFAL